MKHRNKRIVKIVLVFGSLYMAVKTGVRRVKSKDIEIGKILSKREASFQNTPFNYERKVKPIIDKVVSLTGLILLLPVFIIISILIFIDDPGPVFFTQKRVGKGKEIFNLHKFRSMKMSTPHDVPTHQLKDPNQYITRVGRILRKTSLDELPQIWDIFRGKMSIIGPRPALWNQDDLVGEREQYGANQVLPGLTGWAQINGRDELEISEKAKLDGEYIKYLRQGGIKALLFDIKCFFGTIKSVIMSDGVVEGGTGELHKANVENMDSAEAGFNEYAYKKRFNIDKMGYRRILITGANSYIGESFEFYAKKYYSDNFLIDTVDMVDGTWRETDFGMYDVIFHVAGIAHADIGDVDEDTKKNYYAVNTDLAIEVAKLAKSAGVKQFVFMSSMIIYGESAPYGKEKIIDEHTIPAPANFYGDSKWQADKGVRKLADENFHVAVLRPPMIYGAGSKGNYPTLAKLAKKLFVFPNVNNQRSMLYIENFCEFLCLLMLSGEGGIFFPQNAEYTKTVEMVKWIAEISGKQVHTMDMLNLIVDLAGKVPGKIGNLVNKAFGNNIYTQELSQYEGLEYQKFSVRESIVCTESANSTLDVASTASHGGFPNPKPVLILVNHDVVIYNFRLELVERLLEDGYEVHISSPVGEHTEDLKSLGVYFHKISINRHGMNPLDEWKILMEYKRLIKVIHPLIVFTYTVKPNVYGGIAAKTAHVPFVPNITGLGTIINGGGIKKTLVLVLYKFGLYKAQKVFFQNEENKNFMVKNKVVLSSYEVLPGSGVNLDRHCFEPYPEYDGHIIFTTIGRIMKDKGIDELLEAAREVKQRHPEVMFRLIGFFDSDYEKKIRIAEKQGIIKYIEQQRDIHPWLKETHAVIHPSYHEGMSNVLLEAAATGRPVLASDISGCRETFNSMSGIGFKAKSSRDLVRAIEEFINLSYDKKATMGKAGRNKMEREFNRQIVVEKYVDEIRKASGKTVERYGIG